MPLHDSVQVTNVITHTCDFSFGLFLNMLLYIIQVYSCSCFVDQIVCYESCVLNEQVVCYKLCITESVVFCCDSQSCICVC